MMALICEPTPYCRVSFYSRFPNFTVVFLELLPWLEIIGLIILIWALGEKIVNWIKKKKDRNK
ncbi:MAG: hypothetical protein U9O66_00665 [Patescibacteria group bacterium]|nr:hypothetical protein [Patescibacteria group bacterium]